MASKKRATSPAADQASAPKRRALRPVLPHGPHELVIITGISGAGKLSALKTFEDLGYYAVDNLPVGLLLNFADLVRDSAEIERAALVVDIREGGAARQAAATAAVAARLAEDHRPVSRSQ